MKWIFPSYGDPSHMKVQDFMTTLVVRILFHDPSFNGHSAPFPIVKVDLTGRQTCGCRQLVVAYWLHNSCSELMANLGRLNNIFSGFYCNWTSFGDFCLYIDAIFGPCPRPKRQPCQDDLYPAYNTNPCEDEYQWPAVLHDGHRYEAICQIFRNFHCVDNKVWDASNLVR